MRIVVWSIVYRLLFVLWILSFVNKCFGNVIRYTYAGYATEFLLNISPIITLSSDTANRCHIAKGESSITREIIQSRTGVLDYSFRCDGIPFELL
jgi:hypothetical protein